MTVVINGTTGIDTGTGSLIAADSTTSTYMDMFEDTDNGSNYIRLIAPASIASNKTITLPDVTGTVVTTGDTGSVTSTMLATAVQPLGNGQTWQNVTGSRGYGTTYTNSTGRAIMVAIAGSNNTNAAWAILTPTVGGVTLPDARAIVNQSYCFITFIVPTGATYSVTNGGTAMALQLWTELR
jgi:hypothetical protein